MKIRKLVMVIEEIQEDGGRRLEKPLHKVAAVAVIENPFAGRFVDDLQELVKTGEELGDLLGRRAVMGLGAPVHSYGKAAIVGVDGEYEHAAAILHPTLGTPFRALVHGGKAIIPSAKKLFLSGVPLYVMPLDSTQLKFDEVKRAFKLLYLSGLNTRQALEKSKEMEWTDLGQEFFRFLRDTTGKRGICALKRSSNETSI